MLIAPRRKSLLGKLGRRTVYSDTGRVSFFAALCTQGRVLLFYPFCDLEHMKGKNNMKNTIRSLWILVLAFLLALSLISCDQAEKNELPNTEEPQTTAIPEQSTTAGAGSTTAQTTAQTVEKSGLWESAVYLQDKEFGEGSTTIKVEVKVENQSVTFTIHTDKTTLADALLEHSLVSGEDGAFGLYIKIVNGITADYDVDQSYWALTKNGETLMTGASGVNIADGEHYELTRAK